MYWVFLATVPVLLVTGVVLWRPWVASEMPIWALRWAALIHAVTAFVAILTLIIHVYSAIWVKGSIRAMTQGRVSPAWARHHHKLWYDEVMAGEKRGDETALPHREPGDAAASRTRT